MDFRTDAELQKQVLDELTWDVRVTPNEIGVRVRAGVVTLTGRVDSYFKKWSVEEAAHRVRGVNTVANEIEVELPAIAERSDEDIAAAAQNAIAADSVLGTFDLHITVSHGWLTVKGNVDENRRKQDVQHRLARLWGVRGVTNMVDVTAPRESRADQILRDRVS